MCKLVFTRIIKYGVYQNHSVTDVIKWYWAIYHFVTSLTKWFWYVMYINYIILDYLYITMMPKKSEKSYKTTILATTLQYILQYLFSQNYTKYWATFSKGQADKFLKGNLNFTSFIALIEMAVTKSLLLRVDKVCLSS